MHLNEQDMKDDFPNGSRLQLNGSVNTIRVLADRSTCCDQFVIGAPLGHEFIMCALLDDSSV